MSGFPSHCPLRNVIQTLHSEFDILREIPLTACLREANNVANNWRTLTKHVYLLKKTGAEVKDAALADLVGQIQLPAPLNTSPSTDFEEPAEPTVNITSAPSGLQEDPPSQGDIAGGPEDQHRIEATDIPAMFRRGFFDAEDLADDAIQACQPIKHHANDNDE